MADPGQSRTLTSSTTDQVERLRSVRTWRSFVAASPSGGLPGNLPGVLVVEGPLDDRIRSGMGPQRILRCEVLDVTPEPGNAAPPGARAPWAVLVDPSHAPVHLPVEHHHEAEWNWSTSICSARERAGGRAPPATSTWASTRLRPSPGRARDLA